MVKKKDTLHTQLYKSKSIIGGKVTSKPFEENGKTYHYVKKGNKTYKVPVVLRGDDNKIYESYSDLKDKLAYDYNRALYNSVDPRGGKPDLLDAAGYWINAHYKAWTGDANTPEYEKGTSIGDRVADAAWRKRLGFKYDLSLLIDNHDGTFSLPEEVVKEIPTNKKMLKKRVANSEKLLDYSRKYRNSTISSAIKADKQSILALEDVEKGKLGYLNETSYNNRNWVKNGEIVPDLSPLNVLLDYHIGKDDKGMFYGDTYDFNGYDWAVPGEPFEIKGRIKARGGSLFGDGGDFEGLSFTTPVLEDFDIKSKDSSLEFIKPKESIIQEVDNPYHDNGDYSVKGYTSPVKQTDSAEEALNKYWKGPVALARSRAMMEDDKVASSFYNTRKRMADYAKVIETTGNSREAGRFLLVNPTDSEGYIINNRDGVTAHEWGHFFYPGDLNSNTLNNQAQLSHEYLSRLKNIYAPDYKQNKIYRNIPHEIDTTLKVEYSHDKNINEYIPFIYEAREDMRKAGLWDYTTGKALREETFKEYLKQNANSRLGNYTTPSNATWLLNNTAMNSFTPKSNTSYYTSNEKPLFAAEGGNLHSSRQEIKTYDKLSLRERAQIIRAGVKNGLRNLQSIKDLYNEFANGGGLLGLLSPYSHLLNQPKVIY